jgi:hypothetical protein
MQHEKRLQPIQPTLIVVDEADRLRMDSLKQLRVIFDEGATGLIFIGAPRNRATRCTFRAALFAHRHCARVPPWVIRSPPMPSLRTWQADSHIVDRRHQFKSELYPSR